MTINSSRADRSLQILTVSSLLPYPPNTGGITRLYNIYRRLAAKHRITWVSPIWPGTEQYVSESERFCKRVVPLSLNDQIPFPESGWQHLLLRSVAPLHWERLFVYCFGYVSAPGLYWLPASPDRLAQVSAIAASSQFDLVVCEFEGNAEVVPAGNSIPQVVVLHNTQSILFKRIREMYPTTWEDRLFYWPERWKIARYEKRVYSKYDLGITTSVQDRQLLRERCPHLPSELIPNGVDAKEFRPDWSPNTTKSLMFFGHYGYPPNSDGILYFCRTILPLIRERANDVEIWVVGHQPPQELSNYPGVRVIGSVPDVRPYLAQVGAVVTPLRVGGGTRLKILEAFAMGKAVVSTTLGAEGLNAKHGREILLADDPQVFADSALRVLSDDELRTGLGKNARALVEREYDWDIITTRLDQVFQKVVRDHEMKRNGQS